MLVEQAPEHVLSPSSSASTTPTPGSPTLSHAAGIGSGFAPTSATTAGAASSGGSRTPSPQPMVQTPPPTLTFPPGAKYIRPLKITPKPAPGSKDEAAVTEEGAYMWLQQPPRAEPMELPDHRCQSSAGALPHQQDQYRHRQEQHQEHQAATPATQYARYFSRVDKFSGDLSVTCVRPMGLADEQF